MNQRRTRLSLLLLTLLGFIWGSGYSLAKYAMTHGVPPLGYSFWQSAGSAFLLTLFCFISRKRALFNRSYWPWYLICGLLGIAIPNTNMYFIASHIPAGLLAVLVNTVPLVVYPLALLTRQEHFDSFRVLAIVLGMIGIVLIIAPATHTVLSYWSMLTLITPLAFALCSIYISACQPKAVDALEAASGMLIAASLLLTPLIIQQQAFYPLTAPFTTAKLVVLLEIVLSSIGYFLFFKLIRLAGAVFYSLTGGVVSLTGLLWGFIVFDERPDALQWLAIGCVCTALFLLSWRQSRQFKGTNAESNRCTIQCSN
jgi:drug/metabolite transporter (DMT)-like permease